jgi:hypothetical protein
MPHPTGLTPPIGYMDVPRKHVPSQSSGPPGMCTSPPLLLHVTSCLTFFVPSGASGLPRTVIDAVRAPKPTSMKEPTRLPE